MDDTMKKAVKYISDILRDTPTADKLKLIEDTSKQFDRSHGTTTGTGAFKTIQYAINAAAAGDVINVATGLYTEALTIGKNLQLSGAGPSNSMIDPSPTYKCSLVL